MPDALVTAKPPVAEIVQKRSYFLGQWGETTRGKIYLSFCLFVLHSTWNKVLVERCWFGQQE